MIASSVITGQTHGSGRATVARHEMVALAGQTCVSMKVSAHDPGFLYVYLIDSLGAVRAQCLARREPVVVLVRDGGETGGCGSVNGPLPSGVWTLQVMAYGYRDSDQGVRYEIAVSFSEQALPGVAPTLVRDVAERDWATVNDAAPLIYDVFPWERPTGSADGCYRGDLHMHTLLSDGQQTAGALHALATARDLDFMCITEHNIWTTGSLDHGTRVIPGVEITSSKGHWNALGIRGWLDLVGCDETPRLETQEGICALLSAARLQGALCSMNHPLLRPWHWEWDDTPVDAFHALEIWNDPTFPTNSAATESVLKLWDLLWQDGHVIWGLGGSDTHMLPNDSYISGGPPSIVGDPTTVVYAKGASPARILAGIAAGHLYVTRKPTLHFHIALGELMHLPGDLLQVDECMPGDLRYGITVTGVEQALVIWMLNGSPFEAQIVVDGQEATCSIPWREDSPFVCRVEIRSPGNELLAFVNPIYSGLPVPTMHMWGDFVKQVDHELGLGGH